MNGDSCEQLRDTLLEFTIHCLLKRPQNVVGYADDYFGCLNSTGYVYAVNLPGDYCKRTSETAEEEDEEEEERSMTDDNRKDSRDDSLGEFVSPYSSKTAIERQKLLENYQEVFMFRTLRKEQMEKVMDATFKVQVAMGDVLIKENAVGYYFYIITKGAYKSYITDENAQRRRVVQFYNDCGSFGELALIGDTPNTITIEAITNGTLWCLNGETFRNILCKSNNKPHEQ